MKQLLIVLALIFSFASLASAQNAKYKQAMTKARVQLDSAQTAEQFLAAANAFARIGGAEKGEWLPAYYESYSQVMAAFQLLQSEHAKGSEALNAAQSALDRAASLKGDESELGVLKAYLIMGRVSENPMTNGQTMTPQFFETLTKAGEANPDNPRVPLLQAIYTMNMPEFFGGGVEKARPIFEKAKTLFASAERPADELAPSWGKETYAYFAKALDLK
ncbi:MAG TPA: hypothetical protein PKE06_26420 [Flavilitoribacter sp.]|nr:hypothetical protein [Flavilitoribacter sp.]HMQ86830.1 hypothetical protein [Flavilitoribacter sp.]